MAEANPPNNLSPSVELNKSENNPSRLPSSSSFNDNTISDNQAFSAKTRRMEQGSEHLHSSQPSKIPATSRSRRTRKPRTVTNPFSNSPGFSTSQPTKPASNPASYRRQYSNHAPTQPPPNVNSTAQGELMGLGIICMSQQHSFPTAEGGSSFIHHNIHDRQFPPSDTMTGCSIDKSAVVNPFCQDDHNQVGQAVALQQQQLDSMTLPQKLQYFEAQKAANRQQQIMAQQITQQQFQSQKMLNQIQHQQLGLAGQGQIQAPYHQNHLATQQVGFHPHFPIAVPKESQIKFVLTNSQFGQYMSYLRERDARELDLKNQMLNMQSERLALQRHKAIWEQQQRQRQQSSHSSTCMTRDVEASFHSTVVGRQPHSGRNQYQSVRESSANWQQCATGRPTQVGNSGGDARLWNQDENYQSIHGYLQDGRAAATYGVRNNRTPGHGYKQAIPPNTYIVTYDHLQNAGVQDNDTIHDQFPSLQPQDSQSVQPFDHDAPVPSISQSLPLSPSNVHNYHVTPIDGDFSSLDEQIQAQEELESPSIHLPPTFQSNDLVHSNNQEYATSAIGV